MTGQLADFLAAHSERVAELWDQLQGGGVDVRSRNATRGPRQFLSAVLVALSADDLDPLMAFYEIDLEKTAELDERMERALIQLSAIRTAAAQAAREAGLDSDSQLSLALDAADDISAVATRLSSAVARRLCEQVAAVTTASSARGTSMSITLHELRRPLTILNSYGQLLSTGMLGQMPETASVAIEGITASTEMMVRMVNALSEVSRLEDPEDKLVIEPMALTELVQGGVETVAMEAKLKGCRLEQEVDSDVTFRGDRRRLTLALTNIVGNAVKHSPNDATIWVRAFEENGQVHVTVSDQGPGFAPEEAAKLFDKYYRSTAERHRKVPGSGLGLYIVKTVAERHGGTVAARSEPGKGAEFEMVIPRTEKHR
ncbi:MAG TPA: HAMP domain-containing sensor histidine kinase [Candidatus Binatia bacterium]|nr:HAMP domain-containing sensor histidine kinase [Candidatus Binatia bacterium]